MEGPVPRLVDNRLPFFEKGLQILSIDADRSRRIFDSLLKFVLHADLLWHTRVSGIFSQKKIRLKTRPVPMLTAVATSPGSMNEWFKTKRPMRVVPDRSKLMAAIRVP